MPKARGGAGRKGKKSAKKKTFTPVMQQFLAAKEQHPDALVFFRLGDFYELFFEDAMRAAEVLGITQTTRGKDPEGVPIPMAGVPYHAAAGYITKALNAGINVAVCEQMADPSTVKGVVPREVVRVITPALCLEEDALDPRQENLLVALSKAPDGMVSLAAYEWTTGQLRATLLSDSTATLAELYKLEPRELLLPRGGFEDVAQWVQSHALRTVLRHLDRVDPDVIDMELGAAANVFDDTPALRSAVAMVLSYARASQPTGALSVHRTSVYDTSQDLLLSESAVRNLELVRTLDGEKRGSVLHTLDMTCSAMGGRLFRRRLLAPLTDITPIRRRLDRVETFLLNSALRDAVRGLLKKAPDLERLTTKATTGFASPRDVAGIRRALLCARELAPLVDEQQSEVLRGVLGDTCEDLFARLQAELVEEAPANARSGGIIEEGVSEELDELRELMSNGKTMLLDIERRERERTGIASLKVRFNKVFGYFIEVTKSNLKSVPRDYVRKQTIANGERFITDDLSDLGERIARAEDASIALEKEIFDALLSDLAAEQARLRRLASTLADLDVSSALAELAALRDYVRPLVDEGETIALEASRHPVVEALVPPGAFVANDVELNRDDRRVMLVTGPNMSGKSTVMRQVALNVILAQAGSFVPASVAKIGVVDRVFTRVGASDRLAAGDSTFMVEMREAAEILREATPRSLVILDEVGRGTSTYDGLAIAWAITEHLHDVVGSRTLFATHYHELCELQTTCDGLFNMSVAAKEYGDDVVFLHRLVSGSANRSYGVAVARLAGVPPVVVARAKGLLRDLEDGAPLPGGAHAKVRPVDERGTPQLELFAAAPEPKPHAAVTTLRELDVDRMTPVDALVALAALKELVSD